MRTWQTSGRDSTHIENSAGGGKEPNSWLIAFIIIVGLAVLGVFSRDEALQLIGLDPPTKIEAIDDGQ